MPSFSLTKALLSSDPAAFQAATQPTFLSRAAEGRVPKDIVGQWLANDRLYIHLYIPGVACLLSSLKLSESLPLDDHGWNIMALRKWMIGALANVHDEEEFFMEMAGKYGIDLKLPTDSQGHVYEKAKLEGLTCFEALFASLSTYNDEAPLPWLETAVVIWGTEKVYYEAWSQTQARMISADKAAHEILTGSSDADGGALRNAFAPQWSTPGFAQSIDDLSKIIDAAVLRELQEESEGVAFEGIMERALGKWRELLVAEKAFWPVMES